MKWIALLDCNNFFVSCERLFRPDLRTVPTMVLSSNDGCVVARSQEIKDMGIPMGVPYFKLKDIIKDKRTAVFSSNFTHYRDISRRVFSVMKDHVEVMEQYSIDEAFCVLEGGEEEVFAFSKNLRETIYQRVGIPVSLGISNTKTRAKRANALAKKGEGVLLLNDALWDELACEVAIGDIWGVGGRLAMRYKTHDLTTVKAVMEADPSRIERLFGIAGKRLQQELRGQSVWPVEKKKVVQKSIMSSRSFAMATTERGVLEDAIAYHIRQAAADLRDMGAKATTLQVMIRPSRHGDYVLRGGSLEAVLVSPSDNTITFLKEAVSLLHKLYEPEVPYKKAGVVIGGICSAETTQTQLFTDEANEAQSELMLVMDHINNKMGRETLTVGDRRKGQIWKTKQEMISPAYTTRWSDIASVKA